MDIISEQVNKASKELSYKIEQHIRVRIQPKPKWLPNFLWEAILKRLLVMEYFRPTLTEVDKLGGKDGENN